MMSSAYTKFTAAAVQAAPVNRSCDVAFVIPQSAVAIGPRICTIPHKKTGFLTLPVIRGILCGFGT